MSSSMSERLSRSLRSSGLSNPRNLARECVDAVRVMRSGGPGSIPEDPAETFALAEALFPAWDGVFGAGEDAPPSQRGASQNADELLGFVDFVAAKNPKVVVEIGTQRGGTHFVFANGLPTVELTVALDLVLRNRMRLRRFHRPDVDVRQIQGDSRSPLVWAELERMLAGRPIDVLMIDGDHTYFGATEDYRLYAPLVREGGVIALHDIVPDQRLRTGEASATWGGEVPIAWQEAKSEMEHREFVDSWEQDGRGIGAVVYDGNDWPFGSNAASAGAR